MKKLIALMLCLCFLCGSSVLAETMFELPEGIYFGMSYYEEAEKILEEKYEIADQISSRSLSSYCVKIETNAGSYILFFPDIAYLMDSTLIAVGIPIDDFAFSEMHDRLTALYGEPAYSSENGTASPYQPEDASLSVFTHDCRVEYDKTSLVMSGEWSPAVYTDDNAIPDSFFGVIMDYTMNDYEQWEVTASDGSTVLIHDAQYVRSYVVNGKQTADQMEQPVASQHIVRIVPIMK